MLNDKDKDGNKCYVYMGLSSSVMCSGIRDNLVFLV